MKVVQQSIIEQKLALYHSLTPCQKREVKAIAQTALKELAASFAYTGAACFFVATPSGMAGLVIGCSEVSYALSAYSSYFAKPGHDFSAMAARGVSPLAATVCMIGVPLLFKVGLWYFSKPAEPMSQPPKPESLPSS